VHSPLPRSRDPAGEDPSGFGVGSAAADTLPRAPGRRQRLLAARPGGAEISWASQVPARFPRVLRRRHPTRTPARRTPGVRGARPGCTRRLPWRDVGERARDPPFGAHREASPGRHPHVLRLAGDGARARSEPGARGRAGRRPCSRPRKRASSSRRSPRITRGQLPRRPSRSRAHRAHGALVRTGVGRDRNERRGLLPERVAVGFSRALVTEFPRLLTAVDTHRILGTEGFRNQGTFEMAQLLAGHTDARTTRLYDPNSQELPDAEVERIQIRGFADTPVRA
jgi:hypothetical protein